VVGGFADQHSGRPVAYGKAPIHQQSIVVEAVCDDDAEVWVAESDQVTGLITEAGSHI
jgi:Domain of unknown function (DUF1902)